MRCQTGAGDRTVNRGPVSTHSGNPHVSSGSPSFRTQVVPDDVERVRHLVTDTRFFHDHEVEIAVELVEETLLKGVSAGYHFLLADDGPRLVAYACFGPIPCTTSSFDLYWIAVAPTAQRFGWGRRLMSAMEQRVRELNGTQVFIDTSGRDQYSPTRSFYERCGYKLVARLHDFYAPNDDKLIYARSLVELEPVAGSLGRV